MAKAFKLGDYIKPEDVSEMNTERIQYIDLDLIDPDPDNFYLLDGIDDLAENISLVGLLDPLRVRPNGGRYTVESGHRRRAACLLLRDGRNHMFDKGVPCIVTYGEATDNMRRLRLIFANSHTRVLTPPELAKQAEEVTKLLCDLKAQGVDLPGRMREHVAEALNVSASKLARVQAIRNNLAPELLAEYDAGRINESVAYRCSQEDAETQRRIWEDQGSVIHNLTADGISAYVAQLRSFDVRKPDEVTVGADPQIRPEQKDPDSGPKRTQGESAQSAERGRPGPSAPTEASAPEKSPGKPKFFVLPWETEMWRRVKKRREELGLSISDVYEIYGDYSNVIEGYENGEPCEWDPITELSLTDDERNNFADLLHCSLDYLYSRSDIPETAEQLLNNLPTAEDGPPRASAPTWQTGEPPKDGRYFARIDMQDGRIHEAAAEYRAGNWFVFNSPLHLSFKVIGWWPLPEKE